MAQTASTTTDTLPNAPVLPSKVRPRLLSLPSLLVVVLALAAGIGYTIWRSQGQPRTDVIHVNGRMEGYETEIGVKRGGRIEWIGVREGTAVKKGQRLIKLDGIEDQLLAQQLRAAEAQLASVQSDEQQAYSDVERVKSEIEQINSQIQEARLNLQQSQGDTQGKVEQAKSNVAAARAQLVQAQAQAKQAAAEVNLAKINRDRYAELVAEGAINQQQFDQAQTTLDTAVATQEARQAAINAAREQLSAAQGGLTQAQTTGFNPNIRNAQLEALKRKRDQTSAQLKSAWAKVKSAQARVKDAQATKQQSLIQIQDSEKDLNVISPLDGVVTVRSFEPGAVVGSQTKILTVVDPKTIYLRGFIPEGDIGKVRLGQVVKIFLDSAPNKPLKGKVIAIDPQASFTPENIYFQKDRVKQVVGVRISVENPAGCFNPNLPYAGTDLPCAKIGMPGDAEISLQGEG
ncbi:efflux RND transporter periplasmic adaptor subunit [Desmonostoc muscorum CCALA 125]|uniref:Efflux RND transporter periplasmic adaptor subunit n=1 Tax=Desmonostoc muscorum LEGE 12446 TaxID=1828758 RepID=A0A8J6ZLK7_DESMC|nr:efflux RND transporter periplasmic adaptor subunit [Desmonostoc muscorum]MBX9258502.1 efflux RND transporter periplasmic adaptor subunit [Desmonostoc muscorum CCALA 125]MCF2144939.1 efflux RND transporter periplasmic adaptor subunit [Desmonostoc muscorum LEGE 12446]